MCTVGFYRERNVDTVVDDQQGTALSRQHS
jgi:hypothetical protein